MPGCTVYTKKLTFGVPQGSVLGPYSVQFVQQTSLRLGLSPNSMLQAKDRSIMCLITWRSVLMKIKYG